MKYTDAQIKAIDQGRNPAIVSAGAGSGKTAVLTQRVVRMICDKSKDIDPSKIVVVTFTEKAANELKARLDALMRQRITEAVSSADVRFLRTQRMKLRKARISTISSFCFSLLRENIDLATDVSAGFSLIDETRSSALKNDVLSDMLEDFYANGCTEDKNVILENYVIKDDTRLRQLILTVHAKAINHTEPEKWLDRSDDPEVMEHIKETLIGLAKMYAQRYRNEMKELNTAIAEYDGGTKDNDGAITKHREYVQKICDSCGMALVALEKNNFCINDEIKNYIALSPKERAPQDRSEEKQVKAHRDSVKSIFEKYFIKTCDKITSFESDMAKSLPAVTALKNLVLCFDKAYSAEKQRRNCADFSDAERGVYRMLCENGEKVRERSGFSLIIVDEFQDSNELQYEIFKMLTYEKHGLYFVGDIKQSIYGFRGAQPSVFSAICKSDDFDKLPLNENFRSNRCVIDGINTLFDRMMTVEHGGVDYAEDGRLICGLEKDSNSPISDEDRTEVCIVSAEDRKSATVTEAAYIAARIKQMIAQGYKVGSDKRPCTEDDFAIIMRSPKFRIADYVSVLTANGLNVTYTQKASLLDRPEIRLMLSLLKVINDPYNDTELAKVLMSPLYCFTADDMARLRTGTFGFDISRIKAECPDELEQYCLGTKEIVGMKRKPLYSCVMQAVRGYDTSEYKKLHELTKDIKPDAKCAGFVNDLDSFRNAATASSPQELIRSIYDRISADELLSVGDDPATRQANLELLVSYAREYSDYKDGGTLGDLIFNLENMSSLTAAQTAGGHGVKIMSTHMSKGLQFPVVFVANCASSFNDDDYTGDVVISEEYALASKSVDISTMSKIQSPAYHAAAQEVKKQLASEEMRLLYVAATRAENKLIFTANVSKSGEDYISSLDINGAGRKVAKCDGNSYLSWLADALSAECGKVNDMTDGIIDYGDVRYIFYPLAYKSDDRKDAPLSLPALNTGAENADEYTDDKNTTDTPDTVVDGQFRSELENRLTRTYGYEPLTKISAKFTATELAANLREKNGEENYGLFIGKPSFLTENKTGKLSGKRRGDAYHKLMEHIPFEKILDEAGIKSFIENGTADFLNNAERNSIDPADVAKFYDNDAAQRIVAANKNGRLYREFPIFHKLDVSRYDPAIFGADSRDMLVGAEPYVQGIADMFFIEDDGIVLVDYKTDRTDEEQKYKDDYKLQLDIYKDALTKEFSLPVKQMMIYSFTLGRFINLEDSEENK